ncbi:hypothetical protein EVAR_35848_1 [Eumeta japonica]|uniref:Uncharacterized protein n=1 Tax=Eumeta variegata TaxID=151549 RepID=A0A4C1WXI4_EUMVA|nr:hypothetical protein EVAR_35848_1 [Eumeta japonica]
MIGDACIKNDGPFPARIQYIVMKRGGSYIAAEAKTGFTPTVRVADHNMSDIYLENRITSSSTVAASAQSVPGPVHFLVHSSRIPQPTPFKMPKTRSKTAQRSSNGDTDQQQSSEGTTTEASSATTTTTTATTTTEGNTDRTTTTDTSTENRAKHHKHIQTTSRFRSHQQTLRTPTTVGKRKSTCNSRKRTHRIAKKKSSCAHSSSRSRDTEESRKLGGHSDGNPRHYRRTASEKRNDGAKQQNTDELATAAKIDTPPAVCATSTRPASETEQKKQTEIPTAVHATETSPTQHSRPEHIAPLQSTGNMITELATALTRRAGASSAYDLPTFYGAHQEWLMFKASYVDTRTSFTEHENMLRLRKV